MGAEEKSRNVFRYILTSGHEGTHSIPTEQMGALVTRSVVPNLAGLVRGQISADHTERGNLGQFCAGSAPGEWLQGQQSARNPMAYLTCEMKGKLTSTWSSFIQKNVWRRLRTVSRTARRSLHLAGIVQGF